MRWLKYELARSRVISALRKCKTTTTTTTTTDNNNNNDYVNSVCCGLAASCTSEELFSAAYISDDATANTNHGLHMVCSVIFLCI